MTKFYLYFGDFVNKKVLSPFTMMYMLINYFCMRYFNAHIHQGLNPIPHGITLKFKPPNHFKTSLIKVKRFNFIMFGMNCLRILNFKISFIFQNLFKCYK
jgi:hypothetical protein